jgi:OOP family OmpA-OmpF porin
LKKLFLSILVLTVITISVYPQVTDQRSYNPFSERWVLTAEGGITYAFTDFKNPLPDFYGRLMSEYFFPTKNQLIFGFRLQGGFGSLKGERGSEGGLGGYPFDSFQTQIVHAGLGLTTALAVSRVVVPYLYLGGAYLYFDPDSTLGVSTSNLFSFQGELGIRILFSESVSFNLAGALNLQQTDELDGVIAGLNNDAFYTFTGGFSFYIGGIKDSDEDGVFDENDACPETPQGVKVDEFGCPIDSDGDGIPDYLDQCPQTLANVHVDKYGCPIDGDGDGVPDYLDECSNTLPGVSVDIRGCPLDEDQDGVPDYLDKCPGTTIGKEVDKFGCEIKPAEPELPEVVSLVLPGDINFDIGRSELLPAARNSLNKLITILKAHPETNWRIEGHTDNTGSYNLNQRLAYERATSVADYLIRNDIDNSRLKVLGFGPDNPVADNNTVTGRALNRRVSIEMVGIGEDFEANYDASATDVDLKYNSSLDKHVGSMIFTDGRSYSYQVASFRNYQRANREVRRLIANGYNAFIIEVSNLPGLPGTWYRVRVGYFDSIAEAKRHRDSLIE